MTPPATLLSAIFLAALLVLAIWQRRRRPLLALGILLFLSCHLLTGTIIPLELIYEHRNYFASFGLMLVVIPALTTTASSQAGNRSPLIWLRHFLLGVLLVSWAYQTALTASAWGNPIVLAETLAFRDPNSPRAQYELGRTYIVASGYNPSSPFTKAAYAPLEQAARLPGSSILPEQALIFLNSRMGLPTKSAWWDSMIAKLKEHSVGIQDESSLGSLTQCERDGLCNLPKQRMLEAYMAALSHPNPSARLLAMYGDYAWNVLDDRPLGLRMTEAAVTAAPHEPAYRITQIRMLASMDRANEARDAIEQLEKLNLGGRLDDSLTELHNLPGLH
jgi:hypothetical protein